MNKCAWTSVNVQVCIDRCGCSSGCVFVDVYLCVLCQRQQRTRHNIRTGAERDTNAFQSTKKHILRAPVGREGEPRRSGSDKTTESCMEHQSEQTQPAASWDIRAHTQSHIHTHTKPKPAKSCLQRGTRRRHPPNLRPANLGSHNWDLPNQEMEKTKHKPNHEPNKTTPITQATHRPRMLSGPWNLG